MHIPPSRPLGRQLPALFRLGFGCRDVFSFCFVLTKVKSSFLSPHWALHLWGALCITYQPDKWERVSVQNPSE